MIEKVKLNEVAKDLNISGKDLTALLQQRFGGEAKKPQTVLSGEELNFVMEHYTQQHQGGNARTALVEPDGALLLVEDGEGAFRGAVQGAQAFHIVTAHLRKDHVPRPEHDVLHALVDHLFTCIRPQPGLLARIKFAPAAGAVGNQHELGNSALDRAEGFNQLLSVGPATQLRLRLFAQCTRVQTHRPLGGRFSNALLFGALAHQV